MFKNNQLLWAVLGVVIVIIVAAAAYFASLGSTPGANLGKLNREVDATDWRLGPATAKVTLVEYADFECPACAAYAPVVKQLLAAYPNDVAVVYRHFPLAQHRSAKLAASYAEAAGRQGKFWEMNDRLFATQSTWTTQTPAENETYFNNLAKELALNLTTLQTDLKDPAIMAKITSSYAEGEASGVDSTPTFFLNGVQISNPRSENDFKVLIDALLASSTVATTTAL